MISDMSRAVNVHEAKTRFSKLLKRVELGEEVVIAKAGRPVARLVPFVLAGALRRPGTAKGRITVAPDFDAPLSEELASAFLG
jgi:prevent-host-death family protein